MQQFLACLHKYRIFSAPSTANSSFMLQSGIFAKNYMFLGFKSAILWAKFLYYFIPIFCPYGTLKKTDTAIPSKVFHH